MLCNSATGHYIPPLVVYPGVQPHLELWEKFHHVFPESLFGNSESGWMETNLFYDYLQNGFEPAIAQRNITQPVLLLIDGARCHSSIKASEFCEENGIYLYTLYPNATHLIQPLDLALMGSMKKVYREEMRKWYLDNIGEVFDKYQFVDVFRTMYDRSVTLSNAVTGYEIAGIYPWDPFKVKTKKISPGYLYNPEEPLPEVAADVSRTEDSQSSTLSTSSTPVASPSTQVAGPSTQVASPSTQVAGPSTLVTGSSTQVTGLQSPVAGDTPTFKPFEMESMFVKIGNKKFWLIKEVDNPRVESQTEKINKIFEIPKPKRKMGGVRVSGLPRCVSTPQFHQVIQAAEDKKREKREEVEKRKAEWKEKAEQKKCEWEAVARLRAIKKAADAEAKGKSKGKGKGKGRKKIVETSSEDEVSDSDMYDDSSEAESEDFNYMRCAECDTRFAGKSMKTAIGCDNDHCGRWFHRECTDLDLNGKDEKAIQAMAFICRYC